MKKWLFLLITVLLLAACTHKEAVTEDGKPIVKIGYLPTTHAAPLYFMESEADYEIELVRFGKALIKRYLNGRFIVRKFFRKL